MYFDITDIKFAHSVYYFSYYHTTNIFSTVKFHAKFKAMRHIGCKPNRSAQIHSKQRLNQYLQRCKTGRASDAKHPFSKIYSFLDRLQTLRNARRQGNRPDRRTKVRRGAVDAVSKNAFAQPFFTAVRNSFTYPILILYQIIYLHFCGAWVYRQSEAEPKLCLSYFYPVIL